MPIFIHDFNWSDSLQKVVVSIPLKGIEAGKTDVVLTSKYLKISFPPYIFECFFYKSVSEDASTCVVASGIMQVTAVKVDQEPWPQLMIDNADNKSVTRDIREEALRQFSERLQATSSEARAARRADQQLSLQEQMRLEEADRARIEAAKQGERDTAMRELDEFRMRQQRLRDDARRLFKAEEAASQQPNSDHLSISEADAEESGGSSLHIFSAAEAERTKGRRQQQQQQQPQRMSIESVLGVREAGRIGVTFTARVFPTPVRESQKALEDEWLRKQTERRRLADAGEAPDDLSERERDPVWLRDKGNKLFAAGNFQAAVNAYTLAIELKSEMHSLFSNRAACHLKLGNCFKALEDSSKALDLLQPPVEQNQQARVRAHCRRAAAFSGLGAYPEAAVELREAARLEPNSREIAEDLKRITHIIDSATGHADGLNDVDD